MTAVFQSNQNDRVTLERRREDIFLASRSHRDASVLVFSNFIIFAPTLAAWLPGFYRHACLPNRAHETIRPLRRGSREAGLTGSHHLLFLTSLFSSCVNERLFFAHWAQGRELDSASEISSPSCLGSFCSLSCWMKQLFFLLV